MLYKHKVQAVPENITGGFHYTNFLDLIKTENITGGFHYTNFLDLIKVYIIWHWHRVKVSSIMHMTAAGVLVAFWTGDIQVFQ